MLKSLMIALGIFTGACQLAVATDCASKIDQKSGTFVLDLLACLKALENENNELKNRLTAQASFLPKEAVLSFASENGCPSGWVPFRPATARFIIGAGATLQAEYANDERGEALVPKGYLDAKGAQRHLLSKAELPTDPVVLSVFNTPEIGIAVGGAGGDRFVGENPKGGPPLGTGAVGSIVKRVTDPMGAGEAHSIVPPYIALFYCQRVANAANKANEAN
jgi:hypothetical protein